MRSSGLRGLLRALGVGLVFMGLVLLGFAAWLAYRPYRVITTWPAADAQVVDRQLYSTLARGPGPRSASGTVYGEQVLFQYSVKGQSLRSWADIGYRTSSRGELLDWIRKFPVGSRHLVRYSPQDPNRISLAGGFDVASFAPAIVVLRWALLSDGAGVVLFVATRIF